MREATCKCQTLLEIDRQCCVAMRAIVDMQPHAYKNDALVTLHRAAKQRFHEGPLPEPSQAASGGPPEALRPDEQFNRKE